jgi:tetratricopeptide (TPR) repeat protein
MLVEGGHSTWNRIAGALVFIGVLAGYLATVSPTVSFWDAGEFIATSYIMGVPHPPGTPFYVIVGRVFSMLPFGERALGVNLMSALSGALACLFLYLITVKILVRWRGVPETAREKLVIYSAAASSAVAGAFSGSFWINSIEAEVYSPSAFIMAFTVWLMVRWAERRNEPGSRNSLVLICYLLGLSVGLHLGTVLVLPAFALFALLVDWRLFTDAKFIVFTVFVGLIGVSNHLFLPIRSSLNPAIDEANPERWDAFKDCLLRKQYKPMTPFVRQAPWSFQFGMFWRYFKEQWTVQGREWTGLLMLFGAAGGIVHFLKEKKTFVLMGTLFLITSLGLVIYMNFTDHEVRERDYFFSHGFFFFCVWIGMAFAYLADLVSPRKRSHWVAPLCIGLLIFTCSSYYVNFESHNRSGDYNAHDYAYNMLATVDDNGMIFTNGDNDTFPLWFIQEVKGFRKDVRVVNLSLLNTPWYIWQLKHLEPEVPMTFSDEEIDMLRPFRDRDGRIVMVKDLATRSIIEATGEDRPIYFAVTVADYMGLEQRLKLEGLAFRLLPEESRGLVDVEKTLNNLYRVYSYRGLLRPTDEGVVVSAPDLNDIPEMIRIEDLDFSGQYEYDTRVYKDINTRRLVTNYAAAHLRLCINYIESREYDKAVRELERAVKISPGYEGYKDIAVATYGYAGHIDKAESLALEFIAREPRNTNLYMQIFNVYRRANRMGDAEQVLIRLINALPDSPDGYSLLTSFYRDQRRPAKAADVVRKWLQLHPGDRSASNLLQTLEEEARGEPRTGEGSSAGGGPEAADKGS